MNDIYTTPKANLQSGPPGYLVVPEKIRSYRNWSIYHGVQAVVSIVLVGVSLWFVLLAVPLFVYSAFRLPTYILSYKASVLRGKKSKELGAASTLQADQYRDEK